MKTTTYGGGAWKVQSIQRGFNSIVHFLLVQKTNQKRTPLPFDPSGSLCSSGIAENLQFEEQIFLSATPCGASANDNG